MRRVAQSLPWTHPLVTERASAALGELPWGLGAAVGAEQAPWTRGSGWTCAEHLLLLHKSFRDYVNAWVLF